MWEIYAYQNADSLFGIFNAIAAIVGSGNYAGALAAVGFCGFIAALLAYAFAPEKLQGWKWLGTVLLVYSVLLLPKVDVGIVDKTGGAPEKVVANVPLGLAMFGSLTSEIGNTLTEVFETAFQSVGSGLPSELTYQTNGLMFGNRLIRQAGNVVFRDPSFRTDLIEFIHNCTMYDLADGTLDPAAFATTGDVWPLMATPNPARFTTVTGSGTSDVVPCPDAYTSLNGRLPAQVAGIQQTLALQLNPTLPGTTAASVIAPEIQQAYISNNIASAASSATDLIRQNAMINAINDTSDITGQQTNDPAAVMLAVGRAQAVAQTNAFWTNSGKVAEEALPIVRNVIESLIYALFPLMILLLLLTSGRDTLLAFKGYITVLIWIQLWPPLYAILNYMATIYASHELSAAATWGAGQSLSLVTASPIYQNAISTQGVVGNLVISIPIIAWVALKRLENFGTAMVGGLTGLQSAITGASSAAVAGNVSMGNVSIDQQQLAPNRSSAFMRTMQNDVTGDTYSTNVASGRTAVSLLRNQGFASRMVSVKVSANNVAEASHAAEASRSEMVSAERQQAAVWAEAYTKGHGRIRTAANNTSTSSSSYEDVGQSLDKLDQIASQVSARTGLSQQQAAKIAFGLGVKLMGSGVSADRSYLTTLSSDEDKVLRHVTNEQLGEFKKFGDRLSHDQEFRRGLATDNKEAADLSSRLSSTASHAEQAAAAYTQRQAYAERVSQAYEHGESISIDMAQDPQHYEMMRHLAEQYGADSQSAFVLMDAEIARGGLPPVRNTFIDGGVVPTSFPDIQNQYNAQTSAPALQPDIGAQHRHDTVAVAAGTPGRGIGGSGAVGAPPANTPAELRDQIAARGAQIRQETGEVQNNFDQHTGIVQRTDGTLESKTSLLKKTGDQVNADTIDTATAVVQALKQVDGKVEDAVKGIFK
jgi:conjugal transfer mating pair stabilization protein TraG